MTDLNEAPLTVSPSVSTSAETRYNSSLTYVGTPAKTEDSIKITADRVGRQPSQGTAIHSADANDVDLETVEETIDVIADDTILDFR